jgi:hypothetical protein
MKSHTSNLLVFILAVFDSSHEDCGLVREDEAIRNQIFVPSVKDGIQHGLIEQEIAHPLRDYDIDLWERQFNLLHFALEKGDLVRHAVNCDDLARLLDDGGHVNSDYMLCTGLYSKPIRLGIVFIQRRVTNIERIAVPQPTSRTTLSLKRCLF